MNVLEHVVLRLRLLMPAEADTEAGRACLLIDVPNNAVVSLRGSACNGGPVLDLGEHINHFVPSTLDRLVRSRLRGPRAFHGNV